MNKTAAQLGRDRAAAEMQKLLTAAVSSGSPVDFWLGYIGLMSGVAAAQIGIPNAIDMFNTLAKNAEKHLAAGGGPNKELHFDAGGQLVGMKPIRIVN